jgi:translation initiation factor IF-1
MYKWGKIPGKAKIRIWIREAQKRVKSDEG